MSSNSPGALWTPDGMVSVSERDVVPISLKELRALANMHEVCQRLGLTVVCMKCDKSLSGRNDGHSTTASVSCGCRELRFTQS